MPPFTSVRPIRRRKPGARARRSWPARIAGWIVKGVFLFILFSVLWVLLYRVVPPPITFTMIGDSLDGRTVTRDWMSIDRIDRDMVRAAIAAEDGKFCSHHGFDYQAIENAMQRNASGGRIRGGSTISQQTAKNAFLWQGGGYARKGVEAWFTFLIENLWGKRRIMEVYLNIDETGIGTYGVNAASQRYFGHDASAMTPTEAARLAAVFPLPKTRGAIAPKGFTRRYGNIIASRIPIVGRDGLDSCIYKGATAPVNKAPPAVTKAVRPVPGEEFESAKPLPPVENGAQDVPPVSTEPSNAPEPAPPPEQNRIAPPPPAAEPAEGPGNGV
jgi:monofunctional glycosyltransferase